MVVGLRILDGVRKAQSGTAEGSDAESDRAELDTCASGDPFHVGSERAVASSETLPNSGHEAMQLTDVAERRVIRELCFGPRIRSALHLPASTTGS